MPLPDGLGDPSPKGVMPVAGFDLRPALALLCAGISDQPFGCVVFILFALEHVAFLLRVPLRRVAHLRFHARVALKGRCGRVLRHLVVGVVGPRSGLVGAAQAVACGIVAVGLLGQAQGLQCLVWLGLAQAVQRVVVIAGLP